MCDAVPVKFDVLTLERASRIGGRYKASRDYLDFFVNGRSLGCLVAIGDLVGVFGFLDADYERLLARQLTLRAPSELASGRVPIYRCGECADLGCGAVVVRVTGYDDAFGWSELGWESSVSAASTQEPEEEACNTDGPYLLFEREAYLAEFRRYG